MDIDRTKETWTPRERWVPAHVRHMNIPNFGDAWEVFVSGRRGKEWQGIPIEAKGRRSRHIYRCRESLSSVVVRAVCARRQLRVSGEDTVAGACDPSDYAYIAL